MKSNFGFDEDKCIPWHFHYLLYLFHVARL